MVAFPVEASIPVAVLILELFGELPTAVTWVTMMEFEAYPKAWIYLIENVKLRV